MVSLTTIQTSNTSLTPSTTPQISIFIGATSGIGRATLSALAHTSTPSTPLKIYLLGRTSSTTPSAAFITTLSRNCPSAQIIWTPADISLLSDVTRVCSAIKAQENHIDLLFMSAGYAPFTARTETREGLEVAGCLEYYSRILFIKLLLPLLLAARAPRVVSVLAGGKESSSLDLQDLELKKSGAFGGFKAQVLYASMMSATFDALAAAHPRLTLLHSFPGWVNTGNMRRGQTATGALLSKWVFQPLIAPWCIAIEESAQRYLFQCTSAAFGGQGVGCEGEGFENSRGGRKGGFFVVDDKCECAWVGSALMALRERGQREIWEHTEAVLGPYLQVE